MSLLDDYKRVHTTLFTDVVPRAKDTIATLEDALHKAKDGEPVDGALEAFAAVKQVIAEVEAVVHSTQTPTATETVQVQAPQLGGLTLAEIGAQQPAPIAPLIPSDTQVPAPTPVAQPEDAGTDTTTAETTTPTAE